MHKIFDVGHAHTRQAATQRHSGTAPQPDPPAARAPTPPHAFCTKSSCAQPSFTRGSGALPRQSRARSCPPVSPCRRLASAARYAPCGCSAGQPATWFTFMFERTSWLAVCGLGERAWASSDLFALVERDEVLFQALHARAQLVQLSLPPPVKTCVRTPPPTCLQPQEPAQLESKGGGVVFKGRRPLGSTRKPSDGNGADVSAPELLRVYRRLRWCGHDDVRCPPPPGIFLRLRPSPFELFEELKGWSRGS